MCARCILYKFHTNFKGFELNHDNQVVTIFSAPNYVYFEKNLGGIALVDENLEIE